MLRWHGSVIRRKAGSEIREHRLGYCVRSLVLIHPAVPAIVAVALFVVIGATLVLVDAFAPPVLPKGFLTAGQLLGADLLLLLMPPYVVLAWGYVHRRSAVLLGELEELLPGRGYRQRLGAPPSRLVLGGVLGVMYAVLFNLPIETIHDLRVGGMLLVTLVFWVVALWTLIGVLLCARLHISGLFLEAGRDVPIDPYDQTPLEPFARSAISDMVIIVVGLALSTVQSIDAMFRLENYFYTLVVVVPAAFVIVARPMASVHVRLKACKQAELLAVTRMIRDAPKTLTVDQIAALEPLLQRRDRARGISTWPINVAMVSRMVVYGVIPPLAWVAAAFVERLVEGLLGG